jgi:hypothetical protein
MPHYAVWMYVHRPGGVLVQDELRGHALSTEEAEEPDKFRTTVYLTEAELTLLDELKAYFRRQEKRKVDQSQLIREAIRHYRRAVLAR